jgi:hypothetical protein
MKDTYLKKIPFSAWPEQPCCPPECFCLEQNEHKERQQLSEAMEFIAQHGCSAQTLSTAFIQNSLLSSWTTCGVLTWVVWEVMPGVQRSWLGRGATCPDIGKEPAGPGPSHGKVLQKYCLFPTTDLRCHLTWCKKEGVFVNTGKINYLRNFFFLKLSEISFIVPALAHVSI